MLFLERYRAELSTQITGYFSARGSGVSKQEQPYNNSMKERLKGDALRHYNEMVNHLGGEFDEATWHIVTISDKSGNVEEFVGCGKTFSDTKRALRQGWKWLRSHYNEENFSVDLTVGGRLKSYVI